MNFILSSFFNYFKKIAVQTEIQCRDDMLLLLEKKDNSILLDCGCGDGTLTIKTANMIGATKIVGIEIAEENCQQARRHGIETYQIDLNNDLPFDNNYFDVVVASHVIEHLSDTDKFIKELFRVTAPDGLLFLATPNLASLPHILYLIAGKQPTILEVSDEILVGTFSYRGQRIDRIGPAHRRLFTMGALKGFVEYYGFTPEKIVCSGFIPFPKYIAKILCSVDKIHSANIIIKARKMRCTT